MMFSNVGKRVVVMFVAMVLILLAHNLVLLHYFAETEPYGPFLELAGRQRFLAQRVGFLIQRGRTTQDAQAIRAAMKSFEEAVTVFERGGETLGRSYPPAPSGMSASIRAQRNAWTKLDRHLDEIHNMESAGVLEGERLVEELTATSFGLVDEFETWRRTLRRNLVYSIIATSLMALVTLLAALRQAWAKLVTPVRRLRDEVLRVSGNGFHQHSGDELGVVSTVVTEMSESVGRLRYERTRVERELRRVEADYQSVFDNAVAGIFQFNAAGELLLANPAMARILGYASPSELSRSVENVHRDLFVESEHESLVRELGNGRRTIESQTQLRRKDGNVIWALESSAIVQGAGRDDCCESVVVDITEMKKAQERLIELSRLVLHSQDQERRRIARELHDSTGQLLAVLEMNMSDLKNLLGGAVDSVSATSDLAAQCSREIRSMSYLLHPPLLDELGLVYAIREYAHGFTKRAGIEVELDLPTDMARLSQDAEIALFRVIQEALTNIHRHSKSAIARIRIAACADAIAVEVEDEGCGIPPDVLGAGSSSLSRMGVGMRGMEERLRQLGGCLTIASDADGTRIRGALPLPAPEPALT